MEYFHKSASFRVTRIFLFNSRARLDDTLELFERVDGDQVYQRIGATGLETHLLVCFEVRRSIHINSEY